MTSAVIEKQLGENLTWLLQGFVDKVDDALGAVLASRDGLQMAYTGMDQAQAERTGAVMAGLCGMVRGLDRFKNTGGDVRQIGIEHDAGNLFVMGVHLPGEDARHAGVSTELRRVGAILGVETKPDADPGVVGYEMTELITGVREHLSTPIRRRDDR